MVDAWRERTREVSPSVFFEAATSAETPLERKIVERFSEEGSLDGVTKSVADLPCVKRWILVLSRRLDLAVCVVVRFFENGTVDKLLLTYRSLLAKQQLESGLFVLRQFVRANRLDVLRNVIQKEFFKCAAQRKAVKLAMEFVEVLPSECVDCRTYNMLVNICVRARDLDMAVTAAEHMKKRGMEWDLPIYTNLITAYGSGGDVQEAFRLYGEMKAAGLVPDCMVAGALATVCAAKLKASKQGDRRESLVLVERAFGLIQELQSYGISPDVNLYNTLVTCAGRAGHLQRAVELLQTMTGPTCRADSVTYTSLIDACVRAGRRDIAQKTYQLALRELSNPQVFLYTVALEACMCGPEPVDSSTAFEIYRDAERSGCPTDVHFFSTMIRLAGKAGKTDLALSIEDNMRVQGIEQSKVSCSALISAALSARELKLASKIYDSMTSKSIYPDLYQFTNLTLAYTRARRFGDVVRLVEDLVANDMAPDDVMADTLLAAFKDASMADMAFAVYTLLKGKHVPVTERVCFSMLNICHIQIKALRGVTWVKPNQRTVSPAEGIALLKALSGEKRTPDIQSAPLSVWISRSIAIYKSALSSGVMPTLVLLSKVLSCLRIPHLASTKQLQRREINSFKPYSPGGNEDILSDLTISKSTRETCFDDRVIQLVTEAMGQELVEPFSVYQSSEIDLRNYPPCVAEAYVYTMMQTIEFRHKESDYGHKITFKVHPFNPERAQIPSAALKAESTGKPQNREKGHKGVDPKTEDQKEDDRTPLAVVSILRRLRLWHNTEPYAGLITISSRDITRWIRAERLSKESRPMYDEKYKSPFSSKLATQQCDIRMMHEGESVTPDDQE